MLKEIYLDREQTVKFVGQILSISNSVSFGAYNKHKLNKLSEQSVRSSIIPTRWKFAKWHGVEPVLKSALPPTIPEIKDMGFKVYLKTTYNRGYKCKNKKKKYEIMAAMMAWSYSVMHRFIETIANTSKKIVQPLNAEHSHNSHDSYQKCK